MKGVDKQFMPYYLQSRSCDNARCSAAIYKRMDWFRLVLDVKKIIKNKKNLFAELAEPLEEKIYVYEPPLSKEWVDQGSIVDITEESTNDTRPKVSSY